MDWFMGKGRRKDKDVPSPVHEEHRPYMSDDCLNAKITDTDVDSMVTLPAGVDYNEWLATHTISFFEHVNLMYGAVAEFCTSTGCTSMTGPANTQYLWIDEKGKKCKCAAPQYVDYVMSFTQKSLHDESVFPTKFGHVFPTAFESVCKKMFRYLFHVLAHIYHSHYKEVLYMDVHGHLNSLFHHFMSFARKFDLVEEKELCIMSDLHLKLAGANLVLDSNENKENQQSCDQNLQLTPPSGSPVTAPSSEAVENKAC